MHTLVFTVMARMIHRWRCGGGGSRKVGKIRNLIFYVAVRKYPKLSKTGTFACHVGCWCCLRSHAQCKKKSRANLKEYDSFCMGQPFSTPAWATSVPGNLHFGIGWQQEIGNCICWDAVQCFWWLSKCYPPPPCHPRPHSTTVTRVWRRVSHNPKMQV